MTFKIVLFTYLFDTIHLNIHQEKTDNIIKKPCLLLLSYKKHFFLKLEQNEKKNERRFIFAAQ